MDRIADFEDLLRLLEQHQVRYLIIGGMAFVYHAKPRYTEDMDLLVEGTPENVANANRALAEFGSRWLMEPSRPTEVVQVGLPPHRIDLLQEVEGLDFASAWDKKVRGRYGDVEANWIDLDSLLAVKEGIDHPRHQENARVLREVKRRSRRAAGQPTRGPSTKHENDHGQR